MEYFGQLKKKLRELALRNIARSLIIIVWIFVLTMYLLNFTRSYLSENSNLKDISRDFYSLYEQNTTFLQSQKIKDSYHSHGDFESLSNAISRFNSNVSVTSNIILLDENLELMYSSYTDVYETENKYTYMRAIADKLLFFDTDVIHNSVYKNNSRFSDLMITRKVVENGKVIGIASIFVSGYEWSYHILSKYKSDALIVGNLSNVFMYSNPQILNNNYIFTKKSLFETINGVKYTVLSNNNPKLNLTVYVVSERSHQINVVEIVILTLLIGSMWYRQSTKTAEVLIDSNTTSLNHLIDELSHIKNQTGSNRVNIHTGDEYEYVGQHINALLEHLDDLNTKNEALYVLNSNIEMKQLISQYNPHFLFNTLQVIRSIYSFDQKLGEDTIIRLTNLLRYSISNNESFLPLGEDLKYIKDFLLIHRLRFGDRFTYNISVSREAETFIVPKLLIQPILENSIEYGFNEHVTVHIDVIAFVVGNQLVIKVIDDGPGMEDENVDHYNSIKDNEHNTSESIGLYNIARRLYLMDPINNNFTVKNIIGGGLEVKLTITKMQGGKQ